MTFGSGRKGYRGETDAAQKLTKVFYPDGDGKCIRTPMSGAFHGLPAITGDVVLVDSHGNIDLRFPFYFEIKRYKEFLPMSWLLSDVGYLDRWLIKAEELKPSKASYPILMIRGDRSQWVMVFRWSDYFALSESFGFIPSIEGDYSYLRCSVKGKLGWDLVFAPFVVWARWFKREVFVGA